MARAPDSIIEKIDSTRVVENHIQDVLSLEEASSTRILEIYTDIRRKLRDRLELLPADRFEAQAIRGVLAQVEGAVLELSQKLKTELTGQVADVSRAGVSHVVDEIEAFDEKFIGAVQPINIDQVLVADSTKALKLIQYDSSIQTYGRSLIDRINRLLIDATISQTPYASVVQQVAGAAGFWAQEQWRAQRIVRTELHSIYDLARLQGLQEINTRVLPDLLKISVDPIDHRTGLDSIAVKNQIRPLDEPFRFQGRVVDPKTNESKYIEVKPFMNHPNRPNDRGVTAPYRKIWES